MLIYKNNVIRSTIKIPFSKTKNEKMGFFKLTEKKDTGLLSMTKTK